MICKFKLHGRQKCGQGFIGLAQNFSDFAGKVLQAEGLLQECGAALDGTVADDGIFGVSGEVKNFRFGARIEPVGWTSSRPLMPGMTTSVMTRSILP